MIFRFNLRCTATCVFEFGSCKHLVRNITSIKLQSYMCIIDTVTQHIWTMVVIPDYYQDQCVHQAICHIYLPKQLRMSESIHWSVWDQGNPFYFHQLKMTFQGSKVIAKFLKASNFPSCFPKAKANPGASKFHFNGWCNVKIFFKHIYLTNTWLSSWRAKHKRAMSHNISTGNSIKVDVSRMPTKQCGKLLYSYYFLCISSLKDSRKTIYLNAFVDLFMCVPDLRRGFGLISKVHTKSNFPGTVFNL